MEKNPCVCRHCGNRHESDLRTPCPGCSRTDGVVLESVMAELLGDDWYQLCFGGES